MDTLIITRKGVTVDVFVSEDRAKLWSKAEEIEVGLLVWQDFGSHQGASSKRDDELTYAIFTAEVAR